MPPVFAHGRLRLYLLKLLDESPRHGYEVIRLLEERFQGLYAPSAGTVYPRLAKLEKEGLVTHTTEGGRKVYSLTDAGRARTGRPRSGELADLEQEIRDSVSELAAEIRDDVRGAAGDLRREMRAAPPSRPAAAAGTGGPGTDHRQWKQDWRDQARRAKEESRRAREEAQDARQQAKDAQDAAPATRCSGSSGRCRTRSRTTSGAATGRAARARGPGRRLSRAAGPVRPAGADRGPAARGRRARARAADPPDVGRGRRPPAATRPATWNGCWTASATTSATPPATTGVDRRAAARGAPPPVRPPAAHIAVALRTGD